MADPIYFNDIVDSLGHRIEIRDRMEVCQGGPHVGRLFIDGEPFFSNLKFGGPILLESGVLYAPVRKKTIFFNGFEVATINVCKKELKLLGAKSAVIFLKSVENGVLSYSENLEGTSNKQLTISI